MSIGNGRPVDPSRPIFRLGQRVKSGPIYKGNFEPEVLKELLEDLTESDIDEFSIDVIVETAGEKVDLSFDVETRKFRRLREWAIPRQGTHQSFLAFELAKQLFDFAKTNIGENEFGIDLSCEYHRLTIELTYAHSGVVAREYDRAPHIDALLAFEELPIVEGLWSDKSSTRLFDGEYPWADTTKFEQQTHGLELLNIPSKSLSLSRGATLIHGAPDEAGGRWLLRSFIEPVSREMAYQCRTGNFDVPKIGSSVFR